MLQKIKDKMETNHTLIAIVFILVFVVGFAGGIFARSFEVQHLKADVLKKTNTLLEIESQSNIDIGSVKEGAENVTEKTYGELEKISASDLTDMFLSDDESVQRNDFRDGILIEQFRHFEKLLDEMELEIIRKP